MTAQTILRISTVLSESILLMKYETRRRSRLRISHPAQVDVHLKEEGGGGGGGHRCNINFSNGRSIGIVLYGMCSHSLYIKGEN